VVYITLNDLVVRITEIEDEILVFSKNRFIVKGLNKIDRKLYPEIEARASAYLHTTEEERELSAV
jgi:hypothetical protein